ncbi:MAG: DHHA1 domain-containing protein [Deinococcota bacterium]
MTTPLPEQAPLPLPPNLYQVDSYVRTCWATVTNLSEYKSKPAVMLSQTVFYPTSGGQLYDTGSLTLENTDTSVEVVDVVKQNGDVLHVLAEAGLSQGQRVHASINWARRYRHMQRHSGQHLLSQAFIRVNPAFATQSVSLTSPICTLDLAGEPDEASAQQAEKLVNQIARSGLPVNAFNVPEERLGEYRLRRPPKVTGIIRLVNMGGWELSACGGTHVKSTAEVLPVKILRLERVKSGLIRVHFVVGEEALDDYSLKHIVANGLALDFSSQVEDVPARVSSLQVSLTDTKRQMNAQGQRYADLLAERLYHTAKTLAAAKLIVHQLEADDSGLIRPLASALAAKDDVIVLLATVNNDKAQLIFARSQNLEHDMNTLLKESLDVVDGRGGGKPDFAQGAGSKVAGLSEALDVARASLIS